MCVGEYVPEEGKGQPGGVEGCREAQQGQAPREVNHRDEEVLQEPDKKKSKTPTLCI